MRSDAAQNRPEFEAWLAKPGNAEAYASAKEIWDSTAGISRTRIAALSREKQRASGARRWGFATVLAAAVALGGAWLILGNRHEPLIATLPSGQSETTLADGTRVALFEDGRVEAHFSDGERRVVLLRGRARFEVAHDAARPFVVAAGHSETLALGTIFEVDLYRLDRPTVALVEGSVEVRMAGSKKALRLRPGETAEVADSGPRVMTGPPELLLATHIQGDELPLHFVLEKANRVNAVPIRLADPALGALKITGSFDLKDSAALARKLAAALDLDIETTTEGPLLRAPEKK
ncbi:FecR family protein [Sphingopyxis panaciterrae]